MTLMLYLLELRLYLLELRLRGTIPCFFSTWFFSYIWSYGCVLYLFNFAFRRSIYEKGQSQANNHTSYEKFKSVNLCEINLSLKFVIYFYKFFMWSILNFCKKNFSNNICKFIFYYLLSSNFKSNTVFIKEFKPYYYMLVIIFQQ